MPEFRFPIVIGALLCLAVTAGCTSTDLGIEPSMSFAGGDPVLPDSVDTLPSLSGATGPVAAVAEAMRDGAAAIVPTAFAGSTPDGPLASGPFSTARTVAARSPELDALIARYARHHQIPEQLLRRVVNRESTFNPAARNGPYWGLMQILPQTARTMGYDGPASGLLDAETNLIYAGKYLRGAYMTADGNHDLAVRYYSRGYYYDAKANGLLDETGLGRDRRRM